MDSNGFSLGIKNKLSAQKGILSILDSGLEQWEPMNTLFSALQSALETKFNLISYCESLTDPNLPLPPSPTLDFIHKNGLKKLISMFGLDMIKHQKYKNLVLLTRKPFISPDFEIPNECHILVLDLGPDGADILPNPPPSTPVHQPEIPHDADRQVTSPLPGQPAQPDQADQPAGRSQEGGNPTKHASNQFPKIIAKSFPFFCGLKGVKSKFIFDKTKIKIYDQPDGLLGILYLYEGEWHVSSLKSPDGIEVLNNRQTFAEMFWGLWKEKGFVLPAHPESQDPNSSTPPPTDSKQIILQEGEGSTPPLQASRQNQKNCYFFEMISKDDRRRIKYQTNDLLCIGGYNLTENIEIDLSLLSSWYPTWKMVRRVEEFNSIKEIEKSCLDEICSYVAVTQNFERTSFRGLVYHGLLKLQFQPNEYTQELVVLDMMPLYADHVFFKDCPSYRTPKEVVEKVVKKWKVFIESLDSKYTEIEDMNWKDTDVHVQQYGKSSFLSCSLDNTLGSRLLLILAFCLSSFSPRSIPGLAFLSLAPSPP